jgi:hypothetical protein
MIPIIGPMNAPSFFGYLRPVVLVTFLLVIEAMGQGAGPQKIVFIGNSFTHGAGSAAQFYQSHSVTDLNGDGKAGVPALFKAFTVQADLDFDVSIETMGGTGLNHHLKRKAEVLARPWDYVIMHGFSTLDKDNPGNPALLISSVQQMAELLHAQNSHVAIYLQATWSRADQTYPEGTHWHGKGIEVMAQDVRAGYNLAAANSPLITGVIPVGEAWNRAMATGVADPNPYDGISFGQVSLWTNDYYHGSSYGYYLSALVIFGEITGLDPRSLGDQEWCAFGLGLSRSQAAALQQVAHDELQAAKPTAALQPFEPIPAEHQQRAFALPGSITDR